VQLPVHAGFKLQVHDQSGLSAQAKIKSTATSKRIARCPGNCVTGHEVLVPLVAMPPSARIITDKAIYSLGMVGHRAECQFTITLSKTGVRERNFSMSSDEPDLKPIRSSGPILPEKSADITASFRRSVREITNLIS
jgi:hypothetical protein